ncbi:DJ-1/PfpI family protein [Lentisalinibacter orientalis]|uniref:DJ-1/PfpI family protein n=1 Tax=Lentisalinibacter orientalis TaxID=2992241 RepID=UPI00386DD1F4
MARRATVGIVVFDDVEVLDFCGPFEVFSVVRLDEEARREEPSPFDAGLVGETAAPVTTTGGMTVTPRWAFGDCPALDLLLVPGGWGVRRQLENPLLLDWLRERSREVERLCSVCTGSLLLGAAGLLEGRRATTHWRSLDWMAELLPAVEVVRDRHFVRDGSVWTAAGISAGIDLSLRIVAAIHGEETARATARYMEYPWPESDARRIAVPD